MNVRDLDKDSRLRLVRFVCSFAWADLEVQDAERSFVTKLLAELGLDEDERRAADEWLAVPPLPEEVDPMDIPDDHRQVFLSTALQVVGADGNVDSAEMEMLSLFEKLLRGADEDQS
jgi:uncharacterized tellurite resistance protein B-like protein